MKLSRSVCRTASSPAEMTSGSSDAANFPRRNSKTYWGTFALPLTCRTRSLRTTRPGKTSLARWSSRSRTTSGKLVLHDDRSSGGDGARAQYDARSRVEHLQVDGLPLAQVAGDLKGQYSSPVERNANGPRGR